jgi:hypothetical protein
MRENCMCSDIWLFNTPKRPGNSAFEGLLSYPTTHIPYLKTCTDCPFGKAAPYQIHDRPGVHDILPMPR